MDTSTDYEIVPVSAFSDNYIWLLRHGDQAVVVDPGDATPVLDYLDRQKLSLSAILVTHHHADHIGGIEKLLLRFNVPVYGPVGEPIASLSHPLDAGASIKLPSLGAAFEVIAVPGHTRAHIAYYDRNHASCGALFCGDTLFACGCGRIFEGTPMQMRHSLAQLVALPGTTRLYCAHEYTQANIHFALAVDPENAALLVLAEEVAQLRAAHRPTLPTTLKLELTVNPFLRWDAPAIIEAAQRHSGRPVVQADEVFAVIREWKNGY
ncbi:MAG: hydroxyacylglutathione hydrolase [Sterolibacterium sp.]|nr:hydroxyacylglutathione hydrolase [Sterolibacterium sp.]